MKKTLVLYFLIIVLLFGCILLFPIGKLWFTNTKIVEVPIFNVYYVKLDADETEFDVFHSYIQEKGWEEVYREGSGQQFHRDGELFTIGGTDLKTIFVDGRPNF
ncbi:hypothetical protein [Bacillus alkalicellulosilyticus]|uniref:hypothetical protein n=1 Tax=Alkalihalobacterium alkalicellulosilyticum TaxID=1912214 RepID=UPI000997B3FE|nr:hypothetical protein [Bacillus alkalicellulosilyticus]